MNLPLTCKQNLEFTARQHKICRKCQIALLSLDMDPSPEGRWGKLNDWQRMGVNMTGGSDLFQISKYEPNQ